MEKEISILRPFDWVLIAGILVCSLAYNMLEHSFDVIGTVAAVSGLFNVVLAAHGSKWNYVPGVVNVITYAYISYTSNLLGDCLLNLFYFLPFQFYGFYVWNRRGIRQGESCIYARVLKPGKRIAVLTASAVAVLALGFLFFFLKSRAVEGSVISTYHLYSEYPYKDSLTTVAAIFAQFLTARAFVEQWFYWILMDIVSIVIWAMFFMDGVPHSALMLLMYIFWLANALNGLRIWLKMPRKD